MKSANSQLPPGTVLGVWWPETGLNRIRSAFSGPRTAPQRECADLECGWSFALVRKVVARDATEKSCQLPKIRRNRNSCALKLPPKLPPRFRCRSTSFSRNSRTAGSRSTRRRILRLLGLVTKWFSRSLVPDRAIPTYALAISATTRLGCAWKDGRVERFVHFIKDGEKQVLREAILATKRF